MKVEWVRFGDLMHLERREVDVDLGKSYTEIGVRSFGKGLFVKPALEGVDLGNKRVFWIEPDDLVISNVFAWEGAVGVAESQHQGMIGSHRFMTWVPRRPQRVATQYLAQFFGSDAGLRLLRTASPGSAGRNRTLAIKNLEKIKVPVPKPHVQRQIVEHLGGLTMESVHHARLTQLDHVAIPGKTVRIEELVSEVSRVVPVVAGEEYPMQGVRWYGEGMFTREVRSADAVRTRTLNRVESGDLIYNRLFAWKRSFAIADNFGYVSNEFPLFAIEGDRVRPRVLLELLLSLDFARQVDRASSGSTPTSRNRLKVSDFLQLHVNVPPMDLQLKYEEFLRTRDRATPLARRADELSAALLPAARNEIFTSMR